MVGVIRRMNRLRTLVNIRVGPGAAVLPKDVTRLHLEFGLQTYDGHVGPKKFWRDYLPRLKYWNPAVPMVVNRVPVKDGPATLTLYFREAGATLPSDIPQPSSSWKGHSKAPAPVEGERIVTINMKHRRSEAILKEFMDKTGAVQLEPTPQDEADIYHAKKLEEIGAVDRERVRKETEAAKYEKKMLQQAQSEAAAIRAASA
ncbi:hypothetical protein VTK26DRAFT_6913 [Humicola hyalothermophila]